MQTSDPTGRDSKSGVGGTLLQELGYEAGLSERQEAGSRGRTQGTRGSTGSWEGMIRDREGSRGRKRDMGKEEGKCSF